MLAPPNLPDLTPLATAVSSGLTAVAFVVDKVLARRHRKRLPPTAPSADTPIHTLTVAVAELRTMLVAVTASLGDVKASVVAIEDRERERLERRGAAVRPLRRRKVSE